MTLAALWIYRFLTFFWILFAIGFEAERPFDIQNFAISATCAIIAVGLLVRDWQLHASGLLATSAPEVQKHLHASTFILYTLFTFMMTIWIRR
ncbi:MAG: hypothetical protein FJW36_14295 [Acidobacteria bacterium]|nr:hypothetical protein [Acidobacteriota bacterium]